MADRQVKVQCKNVFKDKTSIRESLTRIWAEIISRLEQGGK